MILSSTPLAPSSPLSLFAEARAATRRLDDANPRRDCLDAFVAYVTARDAALSALGLPATAYNARRFYAVATSDAPLSALLVDVDHPLRSDVVDDEVLFLAAVAAYFRRRGERDAQTRLYDIVAFLGAPHHRHNRAVVGAWLDDAIDWWTMRSALHGCARTLTRAVS